MRGSRPACLSFDEQVRFEGKVKIHAKMFKRTREVCEQYCAMRMSPHHRYLCADRFFYCVVEIA